MIFDLSQDPPSAAPCDHTIVCDASNNPPEQVAQGILQADICIHVPDYMLALFEGSDAADSPP